MKISVVISTYNGEHYILEQLESLLTQTLQPDEVLIGDDGSSDQTVDICKSFILNHSLQGKWFVLINESNRGWAENFHFLFKTAKGDLIFPCDQDDIWVEDKIEQMTAKMIEYPKCDLLAGGYIKQYEDGKTSKRERKNFTGALIKLPFDEKMLFVDYPGCVYCFRRKFYDDISLYSFTNYPHDALLIRMGRLLGTAYYYDIPVIYWRRHLKNATGKPIRTNNEMQERIVYYIQCLDQMLRWCKDHQGNDDKLKLINKNKLFYETRLEAFKSGKIVGKNSLFSCLKYLTFYPKPKSIIGDLIRLIH